MFLVILLYIGFSLSFILMKASLFYAQPFFLVAVRMLFAALVLLAWILIRKKWRHIRCSDWFLFFGAALFNIYFTNTFELVGLAQTSVTKAALIFCFSPFLAAFLSYVIWRQRLTLAQWIGLLMGLFGMIILFYPQGNVSSWAITKSDAWLLGAMVATTIGWTFVKKLVFDCGYRSAQVNGVTMLIGGVGSLLTSFFVELWNPLPVSHMSQFLMFVIATSLLSCVICYNLYAWLLRSYSVIFMTFASFLSPFFAAWFGYLFLHEKITLTFVLAFVLLMCGLLIFYKEELNVKRFSNK